MKRLAWILAVAGCGVSTATTPGTTAGGLIAYPARDAAGHQQLFTITASGGARRQLTSEGDNWMPSWSPDGARIVYVSRRGPGAAGLWIMDADGGNKHFLVEGDSPDWGPRGLIVFAAPTTPGTIPELFTIDAQGGSARQLLPSGGHAGRVHPSWSPDGTHIVYTQLEPRDGAPADTSNGCPALPVRPELWIVGADGTRARQLTEAGAFRNEDEDGHLVNSAPDANAADWSPAGDDIAFWSGQEACYGQVWRMHADDTGRVQLTHAPIPAHNDDPAWSPDGRQILFSTDRRGRPELWIMDADGGAPRFLAENAPGPGPADAAWQPRKE